MYNAEHEKDKTLQIYYWAQIWFYSSWVTTQKDSQSHNKFKYLNPLKSTDNHDTEWTVTLSIFGKVYLSEKITVFITQKTL